MKNRAKQVTAEQQDALFNLWQKRFESNMHRHEALSWAAVQERLEASPDKLWSLQQMEQSGGEPDLVGPLEAQKYLFFDCSIETPSGRRNLCYDHDAWASRKANKPQSNAVDTAASMGIEILTEAQYRYLQTFGSFDSKSSSWITTPPAIRERGGALFCDRRFHLKLSSPILIN